MNRLKLITGIICFAVFHGYGQEKNILFSQYQYNSLSINPAYAGSHEVFSATLIKRMQWIGFEGAPNYESLNMHFLGKNTKTGWGINALHENIGIRNYFNLFINYAYRLTLGNGYLSLGLKGGMSSGKQDLSEIDADDPVYNENAHSYMVPNFGIGVYYKARNFFSGISVPLMLGYESGNDGTITAYHDFRQYAYFATGGFSVNIDEKWMLTPSLLVSYEESTGLIMDITVNGLYKKMLGAGLAYRTSGALIFLVNYRINYQTTAFVAYDFGIGGLSRYNRSSVEAGLQIDLEYKINRSNMTIF